MKITIVGSGSILPEANRSDPAILIEHKKKKILMDCGGGIVADLYKQKVKYWDLDYVLITHFHPDHACGLIPLLCAIYLKTHGKGNEKFKRKKTLYLYGPKGFIRFYKTLRKLILKEGIEKTYKIVVKEIKNKIKIEDLNIETFKTKHEKESVGYRIKIKNKIMVYTGDTGYYKNLSKDCKDANVLLIECTFSNKNKIPPHLIPKEVAEIATKANVKKVVAVHIASVTDSKILKKEIAQSFKGKIIISKDGTKIEV